MSRLDSAGGKSAPYVLLILLGITLFYAEVVFFSQVPILRDAAKFFFPMKYYLHLHLQDLTLPLWIPNIFMGRPFLANFQSGIFYPPNLLFFLPAPTAAFRIFFLFHYAILALGAFFYLQYKSCSRPVSFLGALVFTFGGFMVSLGNVLNHLQAASWLPFLLLFHERLMNSPSWRYFLVFTLFELLHFLGGSPEIFLMTNLILFLLTLFRAWSAEKLFSRWSLLLIPTSLGVTLLIALPQILPTLEMIQLSPRSEGLPFADLSRWSFEPISLLNLFFPPRFLSPEGQFGFHALLDTEVPWVLSIYLGALIPSMALFFLWQGQKREKYLWGALLLLGLLLAMGVHTPLFPFLLASFPPLAMFRYPEKFLYFIHLSLFVLSSQGLALLLDTEDQPLRRKALLLLGGVGLTITIPYLFFLFRLDTIVTSLSWMKSHGIALILNPWAIGSLGVNWERFLLITLAAILLLLSYNHAWLKKNTFILLFTALLSLDVLVANRDLNLYADARVLLSPSPIARLCGAPSHDYRTVHGKVDFHNMDSSPMGQELSPSNKLYFAAYDYNTRIPVIKEHELLFLRISYPNTGIIQGLDHFWGPGGIQLTDEIDLLKILTILPLDQQLKLLQTFNVRFLVAPSFLTSSQIVKTIPLAERPLTFYELRSPSPRAYLAYRSHTASDPIETTNLIIQEDFDPQRDVVVHKSRPLTQSRTGPHLIGSPHPNDYVKITSYGDREISLESQSHSPAILVLNDTSYPGWKASVDGRETPILRANWWVRGIAVEEGRHTVVFRYEPATFFLGIKLSLLSLTGLSLLLMLGKISRRGLSLWR